MTRSPKAIVVAATLTALSAVVAVPATAADLLIEVHGVRSDAGRLFIAVHVPRDGVSFPDQETMYAGINEQAKTGATRLVLHDLPAGRYAVNAFHDENGNGDLDTNLLGIPTEGYAFANDPAATFGPPPFGAAAVTVGDAPALATMTMKY